MTEPGGKPYKIMKIYAVAKRGIKLPVGHSNCRATYLSTYFLQNALHIFDYTWTTLSRAPSFTLNHCLPSLTMKRVSSKSVKAIFTQAQALLVVIFDNFDLNCLLTNARSIVNKFAEFQALVDVRVPQVIGITESWCTNSILDAELHLKGYNLY